MHYLRTGLFAVALMAPFAAMAQDAAAPSGPRKHINVIVGQKMMDDKDWNKEMKAAGFPNMATQTSFGLETTWGLGRLPVSLAVDALYASKSGKAGAPLNRTVTGNTLEFGLGARKVFDIGSVPVHPYVGGGLAYGSAAITCSGCTSQDASGAGFFINTGAFYRMSKFNAGLGVRYSSIEGENDGFKIKVGGINVNAVLGVGF